MICLAGSYLSSLFTHVFVNTEIRGIKSVYQSENTHCLAAFIKLVLQGIDLVLETIHRAIHLDSFYLY